MIPRTPTEQTDAFATPQQVLDFWFEELTPKDWFRKDTDLDRTIVARFGETLSAAARCECWHWRETPSGRLAEILVLDQFSRNVHRNTPAAFAQDPLALALAQEAIAAGDDARLSTPQRIFVYMPFMHSESLNASAATHTATPSWDGSRQPRKSSS